MELSRFLELHGYLVKVTCNNNAFYMALQKRDKTTPKYGVATTGDCSLRNALLTFAQSLSNQLACRITVSSRDIRRVMLDNIAA